MARLSTNAFLILAALWLMMFSASAQVIIVAPILPEISEALNIKDSLQGLLITSYTVTLGVVALIIGPISDKVGRRRILLFGCGFMSVALALHGIADSYASMVTVRALAGAAGGSLSGGAVAFVGDFFPYERRGWANGWVMSGMAFGQIVGIPAGKILADQFGFRWPFLMFAATMLVATALVWLFVPQPDVVRDEDRLGVRSSIVKYRALLDQGPIRSVSLVYLLMFLSLGLFVIYLPTWLERVVGVSGTEIASLFFVGGVANVLSSPVAGRLSDTLGRKPLIIASCIGLGVVMVLTTYVIDGIWTAYILFAVARVMFALRISPLQSLMTALVPDERRGMLMSLAIAVGQVGMGLGSGLAGVTYTEFGYVSNTLLATGAIVIMALLVLYHVPEPTGEPASATAVS
ncbi:MAG: MFS transporter [Rhodothermales bacterium]|nr:MFS transporter [Rhodothermales bacterium]